MNFADLYPLYIQKVDRKNRAREKVGQIICRLTGYDQLKLLKNTVYDYIKLSTRSVLRKPSDSPFFYNDILILCQQKSF